jgi:hypothetical protein
MTTRSIHRSIDYECMNVCVHTNIDTYICMQTFNNNSPSEDIGMSEFVKMGLCFSLFSAQQLKPIYKQVASKGSGNKMTFKEFEEALFLIALQTVFKLSPEASKDPPSTDHHDYDKDNGALAGGVQLLLDHMSASDPKALRARLHAYQTTGEAAPPFVPMATAAPPSSSLGALGAGALVDMPPIKINVLRPKSEEGKEHKANEEGGDTHEDKDQDKGRVDDALAADEQPQQPPQPAPST